MPQDSIPRKEGQKKAFRNPKFSLPMVINWLLWRLADVLVKILRVRGVRLHYHSWGILCANFKKQITCGTVWGEWSYPGKSWVRRSESLFLLREEISFFSNLSRVVTALAEENVGREHVIKENLRFNVDHCNWYISAKTGLSHWKMLLLEILSYIF